jgi:hypothetical protein
MWPWWVHERDDRVMVSHDIIFADAQLKVEDIEKFALDPANIALAKYTGAYSPVHIFERRVI